MKLFTAKRKGIHPVQCSETAHNAPLIKLKHVRRDLNSRATRPNLLQAHKTARLHIDHWNSVTNNKHDIINYYSADVLRSVATATLNVMRALVFCRRRYRNDTRLRRNYRHQNILYYYNGHVETWLCQLEKRIRPWNRRATFRSSPAGDE